MFKSGDKVVYIKNDNFLDKRRFYTIYYVSQDNKYCSITGYDFSIFSTSEFIKLNEHRKRKIIKINESR